MAQILSASSNPGVTSWASGAGSILSYPVVGFQNSGGSIAPTQNTTCWCSTDINPISISVAAPEFCGQVLSFFFSTDGGGDVSVSFPTVIDNSGNGVVTMSDASSSFAVIAVAVSGSACRWVLLSNNGCALSSLPSYMLLGSNSTLRLLSLSGGVVSQVSSATVTPPLVNNQDIFAMAKHPTQPWIYATLLTPQAWGNASIQRWSLSGSTLTYLNAVYTYGGNDAPSGMVFNAAGTKLYVQNDRGDVIDEFDVNLITGALTYVQSGADTYLHGLAIPSSGTYIYNGSNTFALADLSTVFSGNGGNANQFMTGNRMAATDDVNDACIYDLSNPALPALITSLAVNNIRDIDISPDETRLLCAQGTNNTLSTLSFDGATLAILDTAAVPYVCRMAKFFPNTNATYALAAWFSGNNVGGYNVYSVAPGGTLTETATVALGETCRTLLPVTW